MNQKRVVGLPLAGKCILLTRPAVQADLSALLLRQRGAEPVVMPLIERRAPPDPAKVAEVVGALEDYDLVVFTSESAVDELFREIEAQGRDARLFAETRIAAIGSTTAAALSRQGLEVAIMPAKFVGEALAEAILEDPCIQAIRPMRSPRILVLRALVAREVLPQRLRSSGCTVDVVPVYETHPVAPASSRELVALLASRAIHCILLTSSSAANALVDLLGPHERSLLEGTLIASIGPITTAAAESRGLAVQLTATDNTLAGLVDVLEGYYTQAW